MNGSQSEAAAEAGRLTDGKVRRWSMMLKALAEPTRFNIIAYLAFKDAASVSEIAEACEIGFVNVSGHLQLLRMAGVVDDRRDGRYCLYGLADGVKLEPKLRRDIVGLNFDGLHIYLTGPDEADEPTPVKPKNRKPKSKKGA